MIGSDEGGALVVLHDREGTSGVQGRPVWEVVPKQDLSKARESPRDICRRNIPEGWRNIPEG